MYLMSKLQTQGQLGDTLAIRVRQARLTQHRQFPVAKFELHPQDYEITVQLDAGQPNRCAFVFLQEGKNALGLDFLLPA